MGANSILKIGDFGLASLSQPNLLLRSFKSGNSSSGKGLNFSRQTGTPLYTAPEQERDDYYNSKTDVYTLGIILFELLSNFKTIHAKIDKIIKLKREAKIDESFLKKYPIESKLVLILTNTKNEDRPESSEIKKLPVFMEWAQDLQKMLNTKEEPSTTCSDKPLTRVDSECQSGPAGLSQKTTSNNV